ncbi:MAG: hypothetical protein AUJ52_06745 [Elusimicrobia bacterium CG1_02_63_36]|nr:MAG: hypothetical protein AUJ52_06745 [Elusimicrobia bacterium CG1_02_63_36]PIP81494.1 MAG: hypothetical protein COR54_19940 [Elusimicrobia bacterium CG22_combo_CG10-13_8_21_14_all_63_91]PJB24302.1 MAG: hypothetical protein CO113_14495 [Elusimicrobia bacterium CG_4_9_14_3_um_filter_62_55]
MTTKEAVIRFIQDLPEDATLGDIMAELYFRQKVDKGRAQLRQGHGISHAKVKSRLKKWLG